MSSRPFRVLHIIDTFGMGGVETWLMEVLRYLRQTGSEIQFDILATSGNRGLFDEEARALGANIFYVAYRRSQILTFLFGFRDVLRRGRYDVIHDHQGYASGLHFLMGAGLTPERCITHFHNRRSSLYYASARSRLMAALGRSLAIRRAYRILGASQQLIDEYAIPQNKLTVAQPLYCGFNPQRFTGDRSEIRESVRAEFGWPSQSRILLNAARLDANRAPNDVRNLKNTDFAVKVAIAAALRDPDMRILFAGDTNETLAMHTAALHRAGVADRVIFTGVRRDIERLMLAADAFFVPSHSEGLGMVAVEAQAAGLSVVASTGTPRDCIVVPDLIRFKSTEDGAAAWASELVALAHSQTARSRAKEISASRFAIEKSVRALAAVYGAPCPSRDGAQPGAGAAGAVA